MIQIVHIHGSDGKKLQARYSKVSNASHAIVFVHGLGEHAARYDRYMHFLTQHGISSMAFDLRGHGTTPGTRGHIVGYELALDDIAAALEMMQQLEPQAKSVLYGHSMGGNLVASYLASRVNPYPAKAVLSSAWIELAFQPSRFQLLLAKVGGVISPGLTQGNGLNSKDLSHLQVEVDAYDNDPLVHKKISAGTFLNVFKQGQMLLKLHFTPDIPVLIMHGELDKITSKNASEQLASNWQQPFKLWLHSKHEPHNDQEMNVVMNFVKDFVLLNSPVR